MREEIIEKRYTVNETAKMLRVNPYTVYRKVGEGLLGHYRFGFGKIEIGESHLREYVSRAEVKAIQK